MNRDKFFRKYACKIRYVVCLIFCFAIVLLVTNSFAVEDGGVYLGVEWNYKDGVLSLKGKNGMLDIVSPWDVYKEDVQEIIIGSSFPQRESWDVFHGYTALTKVVVDTDFFDGTFTFASNIKEVRYTSSQPEFVGGLFTWSRLETITFDNPDADYIIEGDMLFNKAKTDLYYYLGSKEDDVIVPEGVEVIHDGAFAHSRMSSIQLPSSLKEIREEAFSNCIFQQIMIPASCEIIGFNAFGANERLAEVTFLGNHIDFYCDRHFYSGIERRGGYAFSWCTSLREIVLPSCEILPQGIFSGCKQLKTFVIPGDVKTIAYDAFGSCESLISIYLPAGVTDIEECAFEGCDALKSVRFGGSKELKEKIRIHLAGNSYLMNAEWFYLSDVITIPQTVEIIEKESFYGIRASVVYINDTCTTIESKAFSNCNFLCEIHIPSSVVNIAGDFLEDSPNAVIYCKKSSKAAEWAEEHTWPIVFDD